MPQEPDAPVKARAQVLTGPGEFELRELDVPPPGPGELRMRVHACGICGSDKVLAQTCGPGTVLGHEVIAEVESCGPGVTGWRPGDRAIPVGDHIGMGMDRLGGFSEWIVIAASACVSVPATVPSLHAVLGEPLGNGLHFVRRARLRAGQRVAVLGAGQIGLSIIYWARRLGAGRIAVSEPATARAQLARALGADVVLDPTQHANISAAVSDALGERPQLVFEATGRSEVMNQAIHLVGSGGGAVVICGVTLDTMTIRPASLILKETDLIFPLGTVREEVEEVVAALARGEVPADRFVSHRISQAEIPAMLHDLGRPTDRIKVVVEYVG
jgi:(R,R)-butanediol dehydrogenase / meso-butanediol dehydrogenase / diacetyl reductase